MSICGYEKCDAETPLRKGSTKTYNQFCSNYHASRQSALNNPNYKSAASDRSKVYAAKQSAENQQRPCSVCGGPMGFRASKVCSDPECKRTNALANEKARRDAFKAIHGVTPNAMKFRKQRESAS